VPRKVYKKKNFLSIRYAMAIHTGADNLKKIFYVMSAYLCFLTFIVHTFRFKQDEGFL